MSITQQQIKVFDCNDKSLKILGELLSNDTSRKIVKSLIEKEMYTNEISNKLNISVRLVIHHLKKLEELGLLEITHKQIVRKGNEHRYFRMVPGLFVIPNESVEKTGFLKRFFKDGIKFAGIGIAALISWKLLPENFVLSPDTAEHGNDLIVIPFIIIILGLILERIWNKKRRLRPNCS